MKRQRNSHISSIRKGTLSVQKWVVIVIWEVATSQCCRYLPEKNKYLQVSEKWCGNWLWGKYWCYLFKSDTAGLCEVRNCLNMIQWWDLVPTQLFRCQWLMPSILSLKIFPATYPWVRLFLSRIQGNSSLLCSCHTPEQVLLLWPLRELGCLGSRPYHICRGLPLHSGATLEPWPSAPLLLQPWASLL